MATIINYDCAEHYLGLCELRSTLRTLSRRNRRYRSHAMEIPDYRQTVCLFGELLTQARKDGLEPRIIAQATSDLPSEVCVELANMGIAV